MKTRLISAVLAAICLLGILGGCADKDKTVVGTCAGYDVLYEELRFVALSVREQSGELTADELKQAVAEQIAADYAVLTAAKTYFPDLTLESAEIRDAVDAAVKEAIEEYGSKSAYRSFLKEHHLTENYARLLLGRAEVELKWKAELEKALFEGTYLESETAFAEWLNGGNLVRVCRILAATEQEAEQIRADLVAGKSVEKATEGKPDIDVSTKFYLVRGYSEDELLETDAFALTKENPVSAVRQTEAGYRVLVWEESNMEAFSAYQLPTYFKNMRDAEYEAECETILAAAARENPYLPNETGNGIDLMILK